VHAKRGNAQPHLTATPKDVQSRFGLTNCAPQAGAIPTAILLKRERGENADGRKAKIQQA
jgi:hypothetical protein